VHNEAMNNQVVYFSASGQSAYLASLLANKGAQVTELQMVKPIGKIGFFKMLHYGGKATFHKKAKLLPYSFALGPDDRLILISPVWADLPATPINTFLADQSLEGVAPIIIFVSAGGSCKKGKEFLAKRFPKATFYDIALPKKNAAQADELVAKILG
jgi:hypothetical protein